MRVTVERLRLWIMVLAGLLLTGILFFFGYARWQVRRVVRDLPGKLGISVQESAAGYTFSKSDGGHTSFTVHAAKMVQYKNGGHAELHDVSITMYDANGAQADRIYGNDFDYDPGNNVVRANGYVQIDLQGPAATGPRSLTIPSDDSDSKNIVHVKTSDLVFNQKTGLASTPQHIEFRIAEAAGSAQGASFDSRSGVLILQSNVSFNSSMNGSPLVVHAVHAQYDRGSSQLYLLQDQTDYDSSHSSSDQAIVYFRQDGSAFRIDSQGHVTTTDEDQKIISQTSRVDLDAKSRPVQALLDGGVFYIAKEAVRELQGNANSAKLSFGPESTIRHAQLLNAVSVVDTEQIPQPQAQGGRQPATTPVSTTRDVQASQVDIDFAQTQDPTQARPQNRRPIAQHILAVGGARLDIRTLYAATPPQDTQVEGDQLFATLRDGVSVSSLRGTGHTKVVMLTPNGVKQTSTGDTLLMTFADGPQAKASGKPAAQPAAQLESSEQQGNVTLDQLTPAPLSSGHNAAAGPQAQPAEISATAQRATYAASTQMVTLSGDPRIRQVNGDVTATTIQFERNSGNATATGSVKATYRQAGSGSPGSGSKGQAGVSFGGTDPVHVVADHASFDHQKDLTIFYGKGPDARLWQGADSIVATVLELSQSQQTLAAHGDPASDVKAVTAVFTNAGGIAAGQPPSAKKSEQSSVVRVKSRTLFYSDAENQAAFRGGVVAQDGSGSIRANGMDVYLTAVTGPSSNHPAIPPGAAGKPNQAADKPGQTKEVDRIVARGNVQLEQPGRRGTGEELVYTPQDGKSVLTGTGGAPPRLVDQVRGTVTGASLIFNNRDDSVIVSGGTSRVVTETRTAK